MLVNVIETMNLKVYTTTVENLHSAQYQIDKKAAVLEDICL